MRFSAAIALLATVGYAAAQTSSAAAASPTGGSCDAQNIVDACKKSIQGQIDSCKDNDWICLCDQYTNLLTCYNNCPNSADRPPVQNQVTQYCNAAAPLKSASSASAATAGTSAVAQSTMASVTATGSATKAATATGFGVSASATKGAAGVVAAPVSGALAVVLGLAGLL